MTKKSDLAALASAVSVNDLRTVIEAAGRKISTKTIYRIRQQKANPSLETIQSIEVAVAQLQKVAQAERRQADRRTSKQEG